MRTTEAERDKVLRELEKNIEDYLKRGGKIKKLKKGESNAESLSPLMIRRRVTNK